MKVSAHCSIRDLKVTTLVSPSGAPVCPLSCPVLVSQWSCVIQTCAWKTIFRLIYDLVFKDPRGNCFLA